MVAMQSNKSITLYGIPNCDTVKKARVWLQDQDIDFVFHNFKKDGLDRGTIENWLSHVDLDLLINRKGTTWRALSDEQKASCTNRDDAIALMLASPSVIKRPVLQINAANAQQVAIGFTPQLYQPLFK
ncbi:MAG: ArsC family reductase [Undibacterium sp.]|nr:ArsC family reductase [Undibacterium sp.]